MQLLKPGMSCSTKLFANQYSFGKVYRVKKKAKSHMQKHDYSLASECLELRLAAWASFDDPL